jgi:hypothetical protein
LVGGKQVGKNSSNIFIPSGGSRSRDPSLGAGNSKKSNISSKEWI